MSSIQNQPSADESQVFLGRHDAALRQLFMLSLDPDIEFHEKVSKLLCLGCEALALPLGIVSRVEDSAYKVRHVTGPDWAPEIGAAFDVSETYCAHTLAADDVRHFHHAGQSEIASHPCYLAFGLESYIGVPLQVGAESVGTLNFSGPDERSAFTTTDVDLVRLFGRWLSQEWLKWRKSRDLAEKTMLLNAIIEAVPDGIVAVSDERQIQMVNTATENLFGYERDQLLNRNSSLLYPSRDDYERQGGLVYREEIETSVGHFDMPLRKQNGTIFPGSVYLAPLRDGEGTRLGVVGVVRDMSDEKALEQARNELISTVSHELRTPITSINGSLKLLAMERQKLSGPMQVSLDIASRNVDRLVMLVEDILDFEKLSTGEYLAERHEVDLASLVERAVEDIQPFARGHDISVNVAHGHLTQSLIGGDENRLLQVLTNLLSNAVKASSKGSVVEAGTTEDGLGFWIRDYGSGIPKELQSRLFERFTRAPDSYTKGHSGTGLGMSIVRAIVDGHSGTIAYATAEGEGTKFTVSFPPEMTHDPA